MSQAHFPVLVPQGHCQGQARPVVVRCDDLDSRYNEEFWLDLDNEAILREKLVSCSGALGRVAEFL